MSNAQQQTPDQTAVYMPEHIEKVKGTRCLLIGSGADLDNRDLNTLATQLDVTTALECPKTIKSITGRSKGDLPNRYAMYYDNLVRCNKAYGPAVTRDPDIIFTRWLAWTRDERMGFTPEQYANAITVIVNQGMYMSNTEVQWLCEQVGHSHVSCGVCAIAWLLNRGAAQIDLVGFGYHDGKWNRDKVYTTANKAHIPTHNTQGTVDTNPLYDWDKEKAWIMRQPRVHLLD